MSSDTWSFILIWNAASLTAASVLGMPRQRACISATGQMFQQRGHAASGGRVGLILLPLEWFACLFAGNKSWKIFEMQGGWPLYFLCHRAGCVVVLVITATRTPMEFRVRNIFVLRSATLSLVLAPFSAYFGGKLQGVLSSGQAIGSTDQHGSCSLLILFIFFILYCSLCISMLSNPWLLVSLADDPSKYTHSQSFTIIHNHSQSFTIIHSHSQSFTCLWSKFLGDKRVPNTSSRLSREI